MTAPKGKPRTIIPVAEMTDGQLADEHFGQTMAKMRAGDRVKAIEAELDRRGLEYAEGEHFYVSRQIGDIGLLDFKRIKADLGDDIVREYAIPGSTEFWRSKSKKNREAGR